jgi:hypothetical protein
MFTGRQMTPQDELTRRRATFLRHCRLCRVWGILGSCDAALAYPHLSWHERQRLLRLRAATTERPRLAGLAVGCMRSVAEAARRRDQDHPWGRPRRSSRRRQWLVALPAIVIGVLALIVALTVVAPATLLQLISGL